MLPFEMEMLLMFILISAEVFLWGCWWSVYLGPSQNPSPGDSLSHQDLKKPQYSKGNCFLPFFSLCSCFPLLSICQVLLYDLMPGFFCSFMYGQYSSPWDMSTCRPIKLSDLVYYELCRIHYWLHTFNIHAAWLFPTDANRTMWDQINAVTCTSSVSQASTYLDM